MNYDSISIEEVPQPPEIDLALSPSITGTLPLSFTSTKSRASIMI
jgi:hypothetical protein